MLETIRKGLIKDGYNEKAEEFKTSINYLNRFTDPQYVFESKDFAKSALKRVRIVLKKYKKYYEEIMIVNE